MPGRFATMPNQIQIRITGNGIKPETVELSDLVEVLRDFCTALMSTARNAGQTRNETHLSLVAIEDKSCGSLLEMDPRTYRQSDRITQAINTGNPDSITEPAQNALFRLWRRARSNGWDAIEINRNGDGNARIDPDKPLFKKSKFPERTTIVAWVIRTGGFNPTAEIRLPNQQELAIELASTELASYLGESLYKWVELEGDATWDVTDWKLTRFRATAHGKYRSDLAKPSNALNLLAEASGGFWDSVDPDAFMREVRDDQ